jgi:hypothetical protein
MNRAKHLETIVVIMTGLLVFWLIYRPAVLIYIAVGLGVIGAFIPVLAKWIHWAWFKLAEGMGFVMSKVLLSVIFFFFLFPISVIYRIFNKDGLQLKGKAESYWVNRSHRYSGKDLENVW